MISFKQFLAEGKKFDFEKFKNDCEFFFKQLKGTHGMYLMYRGMHDTPADYRIQTWKARTQPRDSSVKLHAEMNKFFQETLGAPIRDWTFVTGSAGDAGVYSSKRDAIAAIFPIGEFEWVSGDSDDAHDLTGFYDRCVSAVRHNAAMKDLPYDEKIDIAIDMMKHKMQSWDWRQNKTLALCLKDKNEIMFKCDKYYVFNITGTTFQSDEMNHLLSSL